MSNEHATLKSNQTMFIVSEWNKKKREESWYKEKEEESLDLFFKGFKTSYLAIYKRREWSVIVKSIMAIVFFVLTDHEQPLAISVAWRFR